MIDRVQSIYRRYIRWKMKPRLLLTIILLCQTLRTYHALTCLRCTTVVQPRNCETVMTCPQSDDVCFVERRTDDFGEEGYALGCISQRSCHNTTSYSSTGPCSHCCDNDLCNQEGCGEIGFPSNRGPICYNCHSPLPDGRCHNVDICRTGEVCSVTGKEKFGTQVFTSQCVPNDDCGPHNVGLFIGKRSSVTEQVVRTYDPYGCFQCCSSDLCNRKCKTQEAHLLDAQWGLWATWSLCTSNCNQTRTRACDNPAPQADGRDCLGYAIQTQSCYMDQCRVDGQWGSWTAWSSCSSQCNQTRSRACDTPAPINGGIDCPGTTLQTKSCYTDQCPVDGHWGSWTAWSVCSTYCKQTRNRSCDNPAPLPGGRDCPGNMTQTRSCYTEQCIVDGQWGSWTAWSLCTSYCNQTRSRACDNPAPFHGGKDCDGNLTQAQSCYTDKCPVDGQWGSWIAWPLCDAFCSQTRTRLCDSPAPLPGGRDCPGHSGQTQDCETAKCSNKDCSELLKHDDSRQSGVYTITTPITHTKIQVFCDMETDGGGWTVFQKRFNGSENFYRNLSDYKHGFGRVYGEHWLGLTYMYEIVSQGGHQLRLDFIRSNGSKGYDVYGNFSLQPGTNYTLYIGSRLRFSGCVSLIADPNGTPNDNAFSTYDHDVDRHNSGDCANYGHGGWWYNKCCQLNANGLYQPGQKEASAMAYSGEEGLEAITMMFKPI
ncbi:SCO-spondin-like [Dreissena polymorpha]|uniref:SCO-spondin-like n=1 Tax=Dreissena polymorpha TaxID=45954 RepID=UPI002264E229|nr:SCO-spondin-like [Dreissena polymorpha]